MKLARNLEAVLRYHFHCHHEDRSPLLTFMITRTHTINCKIHPHAAEFSSGTRTTGQKYIKNTLHILYRSDVPVDMIFQIVQN